MMFRLQNGTAIHLWGIIQVEDYQHPPQEPLEDPIAEILKNATRYIPAPWGSAPMRLIGAKPADLPERLRRGKLPPVMCVGRFVSHLPPGDARGDGYILHLVWLQDAFVPHLAAHNERDLLEIDWASHAEPFRW
jgi:hypothetical protein